MLVGTTIDPVTKRIVSVVLGQSSHQDQQLLDSIIKGVLYGGVISVQHSDGTVDSHELHEQKADEFDEA